MTTATAPMTETNPELLQLFKDKHALLEGHFILSSGRHSDKYLQSALLLQDPSTAEELGCALAESLPGKPDAVVSPAIGGLVIGHEVARAEGCRAIFSEKDEAGKPVLRRGFELKKGEKVWVIEDVITTGLSTGEVIALVEKSGAELMGVGTIVNRSGKPADQIFTQSVPVSALLTIDVQSWPADDCELCKRNIPAVKPGSRKTPL